MPLGETPRAISSHPNRVYTRAQAGRISAYGKTPRATMCAVDVLAASNPARTLNGMRVVDQLNDQCLLSCQVTSDRGV